ncbi:hypothetical protein FPZ24_06605 [Sphingomonas panacisoli]|uniref:SMP-30/Gluconolactonase/LRE-like region domain-containing protein n=1 Tax=Sphingomonas panacisoli TaxID=1813879 RepID=A0A5B8LH38_9SPHN|nr:hypothetical protein [Sphingomonas panacisoli]QDZ07189.1 hypothetical protein FPZ24_06605 [Sphingomonas panacisoli]
MGLTIGLFLAASSAFAELPVQPASTAWPGTEIALGSAQQIDAAAALFPNSSNLQRRRLGAAMEGGDKAGALDAARRLAAMGASLSQGSRTRVGAFIGADAMAALSPRFDANIAPTGASTLFTTVPESHRLIEGLMWDSRAKRLYAATVVDRQLLALTPPNGATVAAAGDFGSLFGGAYDPVRGKLWIASASIEQTPRNVATFTGLLAVDVRGSAKPATILAPAGSNATLGDIAVAADGTVYASDGLKGGIYRCRPGCAQLETFIAPGRFFSSQGMVLSRDQKWLYVADYRYGLAAVERSTGRITRILGDETMMLDGIDALVGYNGDLIAIQNGVGPVRILRLHLSKTGDRVERLDVLERGNPAWGEPSLCVVVGNRLLYVADPQWDRYGDGGVAAADKPARPTPIRALRLR